MSIVHKHRLEAFLADPLYLELKATNQRLWDVCEARRQCVQDQRFDDRFIAESRLEYTTNDKRAAIKQQINQRFDSTIVEVKSYAHLSRGSH
jgi:hypothetical protein